MASELSKGWLPVGLLLSQKFDSIEKIGQIRMPVLIVHGGGDRFVPARFGEALYAAAPEPKKLLLVQNGSHNNSMLVGDADYRQALREVFGPLDEPSAGAGEPPRDGAAGRDECPRQPRPGRRRFQQGIPGKQLAPGGRSDASSRPCRGGCSRGLAFDGVADGSATAALELGMLRRVEQALATGGNP